MSKNDNQAAVENAAAQVLTFVGADQVAEAIKAAGCAVTPIEQDGVVRLHSASHGVGFQVLWGNAQAKDQYADFTFSCPLRVQGGELPAGLLTEWHRTKRFARVSQHGDLISSCWRWTWWRPAACRPITWSSRRRSGRR